MRITRVYTVTAPVVKFANTAIPLTNDDFEGLFKIYTTLSMLKRTLNQILRQTYLSYYRIVLLLFVFRTFHIPENV